MLSYHEYEKVAFEWLMSKHTADPNFTFTVRQSAVKGSEKDYFIGTEKSKYFSTTFWTLPVGFPGSSGDCISLIFQLSNTGYSYLFEFNQTQAPHDSQNQSALNMIRALKQPLQNIFKFKRPVQETNKMYTIQIAAPHKSYGNLDFMLADIDKQLDDIIKLTDIEIEREKISNPDFKAYRVTPAEFTGLLDRLHKRISKYDMTLQSILQNLGTETVTVYFDILTRLLNDLKLKQDSEKIYFNYDKDKLIFGIGQRYVFLVEGGRHFRLISQEKAMDDAESFESDPLAYLNNYPLDYDIQPQYDGLYMAAKEILDLTQKSGHYRFDKKDFREVAFQSRNNKDENVFSNPKNQILFGPPGTGKTYHTINRALEIINDSEVKKLDWADRRAVKELFNKKVESGQIVFTTFHQSFSYEDFVEGIKPEIEEDKEGLRSVVYDVKDGVFKKLCSAARSISIATDNLQAYTFDDAWNELLSEVQNSHDGGTVYKLDILTPKKGINVTEITNNGNLRLKPSGATANSQEYVVSYKRTKELQRAIPDLSKISNIDKEFRAIIGGMNSTAYWAVLNFVNKRISAETLKTEVKPSKDEFVPHILIIDEINRGNVSAIFGELITLIEEGKRLGSEEALEITLPYSKSKFGVPDNVYIIGTMNTADRSVETLDTALRRRFNFHEMLPKPELLSPERMVYDLWAKHTAAEWNDAEWLADEKKLYTLLRSESLLKMNLPEKKAISVKLDNEEVDHTIFQEYFDQTSLNLKDILEKINIRLEKLLSRDHTIGHSFFLGIITEQELQSAFFNKIIPLLQEYFFGDYGKIGLILGSSFIEQIDATEDIFASFEYDDRDMLLEKKVYRIKNFGNQLDSFMEAVRSI